MTHLDPILADRRLSSEIALILACCRWPRSAARDEAIRRAGAAPIDWRRFMVMAQKHRVEALIHDGLNAAGVEVPEELRLALRDKALQIAGRSLMLAGTTLAISDRFEASGISALFVRGSTIEILAYRELGLKSAHDIDVIVERDDLAAASDILRADDWRRTLPAEGLRGDLLDAYLDRCKDVTFVHEARGLDLELHYRLGWNEVFDRVGLGSPRQTVEILHGRTVSTLANEELFTYLC